MGMMPSMTTTVIEAAAAAPSAAQKSIKRKNLKIMPIKKTTSDVDDVLPMVTRHIHVDRILARDAPELQLHAMRGRSLRVAVYAEFFPVAYKSISKRKDGVRGQSYEGFDVDLVKGFCRAVGLTPRFVPFHGFDRMWDHPGQWNQRVDMAIGGISRERGRASPNIEWTLPYFAVRRTVVYNVKNPILRFPDDVTGVVAGTDSSLGMDDAVDKLFRKFGDAAWDHIEIRFQSRDAEDIQDLLDGKIQGLMRGSFIGKAIVAQYPKQLGMADAWDADSESLKPYDREVFAFPCRRGSGLAAKFNAYLLRLSHTGELAELMRKHGML